MVSRDHAVARKRSILKQSCVMFYFYVPLSCFDTLIVHVNSTEYQLFQMKTNLNRERSGRTARYPGGEGVLVIVVAKPNLRTTFSKLVL